MFFCGEKWPTKIFPQQFRWAERSGRYSSVETMWASTGISVSPSLEGVVRLLEKVPTNRNENVLEGCQLVQGTWKD